MNYGVSCFCFFFQSIQEIAVICTCHHEGSIRDHLINMSHITLLRLHLQLQRLLPPPPPACANLKSSSVQASSSNDHRRLKIPRDKCRPGMQTYNNYVTLYRKIRHNAAPKFFSFFLPAESKMPEDRILQVRGQ